MLEPVVIDGRPGMAAYLDETLHMVEKDQAVWVKVVFEDGSRVFYRVKSP